jgi:hypothetical protein
MNSNLLSRQDNNLFRRINNFFRKIFLKEKIKNSSEEKQEGKIEEQYKFEDDENNKKMQFEEIIRVETNNNYITEIKREEFLDKLEKNPKLLYSLPIEKLEKLENYYEESIKKLEGKLAKMKK